MAGRENLEKTIAKILHRHCEFGWAHYYIPSEKFPSLVDELLKVLQPAEEAGEDGDYLDDDPVGDDASASALRIASCSQTGTRVGRMLVASTVAWAVQPSAINFPSRSIA